ncbi:hypothetical protein GS498_20095 [Rhodococcus hoagii]|nr:hypothetical protein [Prescottella equi]
MLMRTGFLVLMAAALPIAGAAGGTKIGSQAFDKMIACTIACLLVRPVWCLRHWLLGDAVSSSDTDDLEPRQRGRADGTDGVILLCAAALVLPSLMRMIVSERRRSRRGGSGAAAVAALGALAMKGAGMMAGGGAPTGAAVASTRRQRLLPAPLVATRHTTGAPTGPGHFGGGR